MKKYFKIFILLFLTIIVVGCGSKKDSKPLKTCTFTVDDSSSNYKLTSKYELYGKNAVVDSIKIEETIESNDNSILEYYQNYFQALYEKNNSEYGGYKNNVEKSGKSIISNTTVSYKDVNMKTYLEKNSIMKSYVDKDYKFLLEGLVSYYEALGATCK